VYLQESVAFSLKNESHKHVLDTTKAVHINCVAAEVNICKRAGLLLVQIHRLIIQQNKWINLIYVQISILIYKFPY
jgi:hypothetical protein